MAIKFENKRLNLTSQNNIVLFSDKNSNINGLNSNDLKKYQSQIKQSINAKKNNNKDFFNFDINPTLKIVVIKITKDLNFSNDNEKLGAKFFGYLDTNLLTRISFLDTNLNFLNQKNSRFLYEFILGFLVKSYKFDKYQTKKNQKNFILNLSGDFKNKFALVLCAADPCLKNLMIFAISFASPDSLGVILNLKENCLSVGPPNNNSRLGLIIAPVVLVTNC